MDRVGFVRDFRVGFVVLKASMSVAEVIRVEGEAVKDLNSKIIGVLVQMQPPSVGQKIGTQDPPLAGCIVMNKSVHGFGDKILKEHIVFFEDHDSSIDLAIKR